MLNILITGSSCGIGRETAVLFLEKGFHVIGMDMLDSSIEDPNYTHYKLDLRYDDLPELGNVEYIFNNAGSQATEDDILNNLKTVIRVTEKYAFNPAIRSVLFNASASAHTGFEFPEYSASKAGMIGYMKNVSWRLIKKSPANYPTCNSISCGGVLTDLNAPVMDDPVLWNNIMDVTPLKKWASVREIAEWAYFMLYINKSCTSQDILIDNGERDANCTFVWPE